MVETYSRQQARLNRAGSTIISWTVLMVVLLALLSSSILASAAQPSAQGKPSILSLAQSTDDVPPSILISSPTMGQVFDNLTVQVAWEAEDLGSGVNHTFLRIDSGNWLNVDGLASFDAQLLLGGHHNVTILAFDVAGNKARASVDFVVMVAPEAPESVNATAGASGISISWARPFDGGSPILSYKVFRSPVAGEFNSVPLATVPILMYFDQDAAAGTKYYYMVRASNSQGDSPASSEVNATLAGGPRPPDAPTGLTARAGMGFVSLSWTAPDNQGASAVVGYNVYRTSVPGANPSTPIAILHNGQRYYIDASLISGAYYYKVSAVNFAEGPRSNETNATVDGIQPGSPGTIASMSLIEKGSAISLSWQAPPQGASPIVRYLIYRNPDPFDPVLINTTTSTAYVDSDVVPGQTYHYWMAAENSQGQGPLSAMMTGTVQSHGAGFDIETILMLALVVVLAGAVVVTIWTRRRK